MFSIENEVTSLSVIIRLSTPYLYNINEWDQCKDNEDKH